MPLKHANMGIVMIAEAPYHIVTNLNAVASFDLEYCLRGLGPMSRAQYLRWAEVCTKLFSVELIHTSCDTACDGFHGVALMVHHW